MPDRVYHYAGVDLHKSNSYVSVVDQNGETVYEERLPNERLSLQKALSQFNTPIRVAVESTFNSYWFVETMCQVGINTVVIDPRKTKAIGIGMVKTDKIDAKTIAELNRLNSLSMTYVPKKDIQEIREITRQRVDLVSIRTQTKNRVINILHRNCIYKLPYRDMFGKGGRKWLKRESLDVFPYQRIMIKRYLQLISDLDKQIELLDQDVKRYAKDYYSVKLLKTMPGIADNTALSLIAEIGNVHRFPSSKALSKYAGLVPGVYSSNQTTVHGSITKQGSKYIRRALGFTVKHLIKDNEYLGDFYKRKSKQIGKKKAKTACMRKALTYIYQMMKNDIEYKDLDVTKRKVAKINPRRQA
jgi:transposase